MWPVGAVRWTDRRLFGRKAPFDFAAPGGPDVGLVGDSVEMNRRRYSAVNNCRMRVIGAVGASYIITEGPDGPLSD